MLRRERHGIKKFKIFDRSHLPDSLRSLSPNFVSGEVHVAAIQLKLSPTNLLLAQADDLEQSQGVGGG